MADASRNFQESAPIEFNNDKAICATNKWEFSSTAYTHLAMEEWAPIELSGGSTHPAAKLWAMGKQDDKCLAGLTRSDDTLCRGRRRAIHILLNIIVYFLLAFHGKNDGRRLAGRYMGQWDYSTFKYMHGDQDLLSSAIWACET